MSLTEFLVYLTGVGVVFAISWLFEYFNLFQTLEPKNKKLVMLGVCAVVSISARLVLQFVPAETIKVVAPYFDGVAVIFAYLFLSDGFHAVTKAKKG